MCLREFLLNDASENLKRLLNRIPAIDNDTGRLLAQTRDAW
jgi:hypothetical protein